MKGKPRVFKWYDKWAVDYPPAHTISSRSIVSLGRYMETGYVSSRVVVESF